MTVFANPTIRLNVKADIAAISKLIAQNLADIQRIKVQIANLTASAAAQTAADAQATIQLQQAVVQAQNVLNGLVAPTPIPAPSINLGPIPVTSDFSTVNSKATFRKYLATHFASVPDKGIFGGVSLRTLIVSQHFDQLWPVVQTYLAQKDPYNAFVQADAAYRAQRASATISLQQAQAAQAAHAVATIGRSNAGAAAVAAARTQLQQLTPVVAALADAESELWGALIDISPTAPTNIYNKIFQYLSIHSQAIPAQLLSDLKGRDTDVQMELAKLSAKKRPQPDGAISLTLSVLGLLVCYYDVRKIALQQGLGIALILFGAYQLAKKFQLAIESAGQNIHLAAGAIQKIAFQVTQFLNHLNNQLDVTNANAIALMHGLRVNSQQLVNTVDVNLTKLTLTAQTTHYQFNLWSNNIRGDIERHVKYITAAGQAAIGQVADAIQNFRLF